jgi:cell wall-associated NlpC family hydrolase
MIDFGDLIGIPFKNGGRDFNGCDCLGLTMLAFRLEGVVLPDYAISCLDVAAIDSQIDRSRPQWRRIDRPRIPCIVVMRMDPDAPDMCSHLGVYIGANRILHTIPRHNSSTIRLDHPLLQGKIEGFYEYTG